MVSELKNGSQIPSLEERYLYLTRRHLDCRPNEDQFLREWFQNFRKF